MAPPRAIPTVDELRKAITIYMDMAYGREVESWPHTECLPDTQVDPEQWLMSDVLEREPADAPLGKVRSFALRLGNPLYPHMKLRVTRPPRQSGYVFSVDSHDMFLRAPEGSPDAVALEELKQANAALARRIVERWHAVGIRTEHDHVREMIRQIKQRRGQGGDSASPQ